MVCYADDTLVLAGGRLWHETVGFTEDAVACAVRAIQDLGLSVSPAKSGALFFFDQRRRGTAPPWLTVSINGEDVPVGVRMKYLGLTIDSQWTFGPHFEQLVPKVTAAANALCGLHLFRTSAVRELEFIGSTREWYGSESSMGLPYGSRI
jgi:hypothetical protein